MNAIGPDPGKILEHIRQANDTGAEVIAPADCTAAQNEAFRALGRAGLIFYDGAHGWRITHKGRRQIGGRL